MEYFRTDDGQIQADLARRLGIVLEQYHHQIKSEEKYEVSLCLSILQTLLTNCVELTDALSKKQDIVNPFLSSPILLDSLGFNEDNIIYSSFYQPKVNAMDIIHHLRNSMSHPTKLYINEEFKTTGYTTIQSSGKIEKIVFVASSDIRWGKLITYKTIEQAKSVLNKNFSFFPPDIEIVQDGRFFFSLYGKPFYRVFEIMFSPTNLLNLTYALATYLSHPLQQQWDGKTFLIKKLAA